MYFFGQLSNFIFFKNTNMNFGTRSTKLTYCTLG